MTPLHTPKQVSAERLREIADHSAKGHLTAYSPDDIHAICAELLTRRSSAGVKGEDEEDLASDDRWNAGVNYAIERLCEIMGVDPKSISWDAATETLDGDVMSVICNVMVAAYGDEWSGNERETATIRAALELPSHAGEDDGAAAWATEPSGLEVATIEHDEFSLIEISKGYSRKNSHHLTIHRLSEETGRRDDLSIELTASEARKVADALRPSPSVPPQGETSDDTEIETTWRDLALQFDEHRIQALETLRQLVRGIEEYRTARDILREPFEAAKVFLATPPLSGKAIYERVRAQVLASQTQGEGGRPCRFHRARAGEGIGRDKKPSKSVGHRCRPASGTELERAWPELFTVEERKAILQKAETLWSDLQANNLGGYSGINRPFHILHVFKEVIEDFGHRDVGLSWSKNDLDAAIASRQPTSGERE